MANYYDSIDIMWDDTAGDFVLSNEGDIASTIHDPLRAVLQDIFTRVKSDKGDWSETPRLGASLSDFVGEANSENTGLQIRKRLLSALQTYGTINESDIFIDVVPISNSQVAVTIKLATLPTALNSSTRILSRTFVYSYVENNVYERR